MDSPYKGLVPYAEEDAGYFFGRETEKRVIGANLRASRLTLLYGESGVGKSSLLNAGVAHDFKDDPDYTVVVLRTWHGDPVLALATAIGEVVPELGRTFEAATWPHLASDLQQWNEHVTDEDRRTLLIILDQFEEYFQYHPPQSAQPRDQGPYAFAEQLPELLASEDLPVNFLISIREDSLAKLDRFEGRIPILFDNYLRIEHLHREAARAAITEPIETYNKLNRPTGEQFVPQPALVEAVLDQVKTGEVPLGEAAEGIGVVAGAAEPAEGLIEAPYLQLVMARLWDEEQKAGSTTLHLKTLHDLGGAKRIVQTHLDEVMGALSPGEQEAAAAVFRYFVTPSGAKVAYSASDVARMADRDLSEIEPVLEKLSSKEVRVLRPVRPAPGQPTALRYEIFHDVLAPAILDWRVRHVNARETWTNAALNSTLNHFLTQERAEARRFRLLAWALAAALVLAVAAAVVAWVEKREAQRNQRAATVRGLVWSSMLSLDENPERSLLLATHAVQITHSTGGTALPEAEDQLHRAVLSSSVRMTLFGHSDLVSSVAWSPDGERLTTGSADHTAKVWDAATGEELLTLSGHNAPVSSVAWSPDGKRLATGSGDNIARVWDAATGKELLSMPGHSAPVLSVAWSPDGKRLATGSWDMTSRVWDAATGKQLLSLSGHGGSVSSVAWSPDGKRLATGSYDKTARVWDAGTGDELLSMSGHSDLVSCVAWSPDGKRLVTGSDDRTAKVWDATTGKQLLSLSGHDGSVYGVVWSPNGKRLATGSDDRTAKVWDAGTGKELLTLSGHTSSVYGVAWSPDGERLATGSWDKTAKVWDTGTAKELLSSSGHGGSVYSVAWSPDGERLAMGSGDHTAKVWDAATGKELLSLSGHSGSVYSVAWSPNGKRVATGSDDRTAKVWDAATGKELLSLSDYSGAISSVAWSPDGRRLATGSGDHTAKVWDAATGKELLSLSGKSGPVSSVAWSPDGKRLATGSGDKTAKVWDAATGKESLSLPGHSNYVLCEAWSPDGKRLATASGDHTAKVWDAATGKELLSLSGHNGFVDSVAWSPDGKRVATASGDKAVKVWDAGTGEELLSLSGHSGPVSTVAWSPDGKRLAAGSEDTTLQVYAIDIELLMALARQRVTRNLTPEECRKYLHMDKCPPIP